MKELSIRDESIALSKESKELIDAVLNHMHLEYIVDVLRSYARRSID